MDKPTDSYGHMLEKYRELDEDEILANLTDEQLHQLEGEINREVLNVPQEELDQYEYESSSDEYSSASEEEVLERRKPRLSTIQTKHLNRSLEKQKSLERQRSLERQKTLENQQSVDPGDPKRKSSRSSHQFKVPALRKTKSRENVKRQKSEEGGELKKELMQAIKHRTKRRTSRANSGIGISRRYNRRNSSCLLRPIRKPKIAKEEKRDANVNRNFITQEMLSLRPKLKKVQTREPAKVNDMLHGVSLSHVTSGAKSKEMSGEESPDPSPETISSSSSSDAENESPNHGPDEDEDDESPNIDEPVTTANDDVHRRLNTRRVLNDVRNDDTMSCTAPGSTSAESYDVIGELSINPNSVEETLLRIGADDVHLIEVNLNNIQNVDMDVFEELASAMEKNKHVKILSLANVGLTDKPARALATMLKRNKTLEKLNVESNFISGDAALRVVSALRKNSRITELRIDNQRHIFGAKVEHEFAKILKENKSLLRFGYQFSNPGPRMSASNSLTRNMDDVRKKRVIKQKKRAQASRPLQRQQHHDWQARRWPQKPQVQGIPIYLHPGVSEEDVKNYLDNMDPQQYALLQHWFVTQHMNQAREEPPTHRHVKEEPHAHNCERVIPSAQHLARNESSVPHPENNQPSPQYLTREDLHSQHSSYREPNPNRHLTPSYPERSPSPRREPSPRDKLLESIRNPKLAMKSTEKKQSSNRNPPNAPSESEVAQTNASKQNITRNHANHHVQNPAPQTEKRIAAQIRDDVRMATPASSTSEELIPWKEGDEYDSDLYDMVELELSGSDEGTPEVASGKHLPSETAPTQTHVVPDERSKTSSGVSSWSGNGKPDPQDGIIKPLHELQLYDRSYPQGRNSPDQRGLSLGLRKKLNYSPISSASSPSLSPSIPRSVRDDNSWISSRSSHR